MSLSLARPTAQRNEAAGTPSAARAHRTAVPSPSDLSEREADRNARRIDSLDPGLGAERSRASFARVPARAAPASAPALAGSGSSAGQPLDPSSREFFEPRFRCDFSQVRVHADAAAARSARSLGARAYSAGSDIVFHEGEYRPHSADGRALLAHELTHVVQQSGAPSPLVHTRSSAPIARAPLDLAQVDRELAAGEPLTQAEGDIGFGASRGSRAAQPSSDSALPISAFVFRRTPATPTAGAAGTPTPTSPPVSGTASTADSDIRDSGLPGGVPDAEQTAPATPASAAGPSSSSPRALIIGGVHGDERGPLDLVRQLQTELSAANAPLRRDFDAILIPIMNPGGVADHTRHNRRGVDLNRNFPGLTGFPAPAAGVAIPPRQPEVQAVMNAVQQLHPARILALHAIEQPAKGGVFADPVEGEARELAARMALRMRGGALGSGAASDANVRGNAIDHGVFSGRYPETAAVSVTTRQSSLGAWASAPRSVGGQATAVITHEVGGKAPLAASGSGRSVDTLMPGLREFLVDAGHAASEADALLSGSISESFLTGEDSAADRELRNSVEAIVQSRFGDMAAFYSSVWRPANLAATPALPAHLTKTQTRSFSDQAQIMRGQLSALRRTSTDAEIRGAIETAMQTRSMPGFSRHHWGTDIDVLSANRPDWLGHGRFVPVIPFLETEAPRFGFFHPYASAGSGSTGFPDAAAPHYVEEPWHLSYAPLATVLQREWAARITGAVLNNLIERTAAAVRGSVPQARMKAILLGMNLSSFQTNVAPPP